MYIHENYPGQVVYCMGTRSLVKELREAGIQVVTEVDDRASIVLIGFDTENTSEKIRNCLLYTSPWCLGGIIQITAEHNAKKQYGIDNVLFAKRHKKYGADNKADDKCQSNASRFSFGECAV